MQRLLKTLKSAQESLRSFTLLGQTVSISLTFNGILSFYLIEDTCFQKCTEFFFRFLSILFSHLCSSYFMVALTILGKFVIKEIRLTFLKISVEVIIFLQVIF